MGSKSSEEIEVDLAELAEKADFERAAYLMELGWSRPGQTAPGLLPYLEDSALLVRMAAAQARWQTEGDAAELDRLVAILLAGLTCGDEELSLTAGTALANMGEAAATPLSRAFEKSGRSEPLIVRVLGEIGGEEAIEFLRGVKNSADPEVAEEAAEALEELAAEVEHD